MKQTLIKILGYLNISEQLGRILLFSVLFFLAGRYAYINYFDLPLPDSIRYDIVVIPLLYGLNVLSDYFKTRCLNKKKDNT